jgi:hypothetical protein
MNSNNNSKPEPLAVSPRQAIELLPIGTTKLYQLINNGELETTLVHGRRWIDYQSLKRYAGLA